MSVNKKDKGSMSGTHRLVIVESPAKAKTINKYLGDQYTVLASYGHVRDLPPKDGSVRPDDNFAMDWDEGERSGKAISEITRAAKSADEILLATDPDREGEAIAWHVREILEARHLTDRPVHRISFNEITKTAIQKAITQPRELDQDLIDAYLARRGLDYLFGFTLSPILWRKLPGSKSAGRVQSVALRLICEREAEIERFIAREYWSLSVQLRTEKHEMFSARLFALQGEKLDKFAITTADAANDLVTKVQQSRFSVHNVEKRQARRNPYAPFTTSTLQQEASRKLGLGATRTMRLAQQLYEGVDIGGETVGLITYMRTDGVQISAEAVAAARELIGRDYGAAYLPAQPRVYKSIAKNAQEAHEAIRPTDLTRKPDALAHTLEPDALKLYQLIWQRTLASQMESAVFDQVTADLQDAAGGITLRATGSTLRFDGFQRVYAEERDDTVTEEDDSSARLPDLSSGQNLDTESVTPRQHFTEPPPRYSEASLVKKLEELGIGRPSTYASTMQVLQDRSYVQLEKKRFVPEDRGVIVSAFLTNFFGNFVEYGFTAGLENKLDDVSGGRLQWQKLLREFWDNFSGAIKDIADLKVSNVLDVLDEKLGPHFFPPRNDGSNPRACPSCADGRVGLKLGKFGAFLGCSNYPQCKYTRPLAVLSETESGQAAFASAGPKILGDHPDSGLPISLRLGPYGPYVQLGPAETPITETPIVTAPEAEAKPEQADTEEETKGKTKAKKKKSVKKIEAPKPKRTSLPRGMEAASITLEVALALLALPREVGKHPETGEMILAGLGRFGPYLKHGPAYKTLPAGDDVLTVGINRAVSLLAEPAAARGGRAPGRVLGEHPENQKPVTQHTGRYGPYVKWGDLIANLPKGADPDAFTLTEAVQALQARRESSGGKTALKKKAPAKAKEKSAKSKSAKTKATTKGKPPSKTKAA